ncbi:hypothetical protein MTO96_044058 [Rhipicephalus appendiculatus]
MLGAAFLFSLLDLLNSTDYLYYTRLLDETSRKTFAGWIQMIESWVGRKEYLRAVDMMDRIVFNAPPRGVPSTVYQLLTGYENHGSIAKTQQPPEVKKILRLCK